MILITASFLIPKGFRGITIFPFIFIKNQQDKKDFILINHEKIHLQQQLELLIIPFYIWYLIEFLYYLYYFKNTNKAYHKAYHCICFEKEAYKNETNVLYLNNRPVFNFFKYLKNKRSKNKQKINKK